MGHFGFSYMGIVFLLLLMIPNLVWLKHQPKGYDPSHENKVLCLFERVGEVLVSITVLIFSDYNFQGWNLWSIWLLLALLFMAFYEIWWIRYFKSAKELQDMYANFGILPVAGATLPIIAFIFLGIYGKVIWLILSVIILGIGHIGIHLQHRQDIERNK
ncbi:hypothetical protein [Beduini massiliensis]|uniref:hypothetical protein n=1 Tax=Beduini massiliensis TaxID=1585974 RepID=UPI00059A8418|nr:hypothetical protein [Beduini massiliensis]